MVLVKKIHNRGANIVVEANAELLFAATGPVGLWSNLFRKRIEGFTAAAAPHGRKAGRPVWAHEPRAHGRGLAQSFTSDVSYRPSRLRVYAAVGSSSAYAAYVDQGTGIYGGNGPYEAKILPPWKRFQASLYESTWQPGAKTVDPVMIKGQPGQFFFDAGLKRAFQSMRMRSFQVPGDAQVAKALSEIPASLTNFIGNTPVDAAFIASLEQWRLWRDAAWANHEQLGRGTHAGLKRSSVLARRSAVAREQQRATANKTAAQRKSAAEAEKTALRAKVERARKKIASDKEKEITAQRRTANAAAERNAKRAKASRIAGELQSEARAWAIKNGVRSAQLSTKKVNGIVTGIRLDYQTKSGQTKSKTFGKF